MPFACIYVPNFPVAATLRAEPELKRMPLPFSKQASLETIIAVNEKAARMGMAPGMTKSQAELCSEFVLRPRSRLQESAAHAALLDAPSRFLPVWKMPLATQLCSISRAWNLFRIIPGNCARHLPPRNYSRTRSERCRSFQSDRPYSRLVVFPASP